MTVMNMDIDKARRDQIVVGISLSVYGALEIRAWPNYFQIFRDDQAINDHWPHPPAADLIWL
jgi:hypothetical protein